MSKVSLSVRVDAGVIEHNNREFFAKNVNPEKVKDNIIYKQENLREVYQKLFGEIIDVFARHWVDLAAVAFIGAIYLIIKFTKGGKEK